MFAGFICYTFIYIYTKLILMLINAQRGAALALFLSDLNIKTTL